jgi:hypothetical protein
MKRFILAALAGLIATPAIAATHVADLITVSEPTYAVPIEGRQRFGERILAMCPANEWRLIETGDGPELVCLETEAHYSIRP